MKTQKSQSRNHRLLTMARTTVNKQFKSEPRKKTPPMKISSRILALKINDSHSTQAQNSTATSQTSPSPMARPLSFRKQK